MSDGKDAIGWAIGAYADINAGRVFILPFLAEAIDKTALRSTLVTTWTISIDGRTLQKFTVRYLV